jgi:hypothetical protein
MPSTEATGCEPPAGHGNERSLGRPPPENREYRHPPCYGISLISPPAPRAHIFRMTDRTPLQPPAYVALFDVASSDVVERFLAILEGLMYAVAAHSGIFALPLRLWVAREMRQLREYVSAIMAKAARDALRRPPARNEPAPEPIRPSPALEAPGPDFDEGIQTSSGRARAFRVVAGTSVDPLEPVPSSDHGLLVQAAPQEPRLRIVPPEPRHAHVSGRAYLRVPARRVWTSHPPRNFKTRNHAAPTHVQNVTILQQIALPLTPV